MKHILFTLGKVKTGAETVTKTIARMLDPKKYIHRFITIKENTDVYQLIVEKKPDILFCSQIHLCKKVCYGVEKYRADGHNLELIFRCNYMLQDVSDNVRKQAADVYPKADKIIAQSSLMREQLIRDFQLNPDKVEVKRNPVDKKRIKMLAGYKSPYPADGKKHFVWVGRFDPIKDLETLLNAFTIVHQENNNTSLYLVGDCPEPTYYQQEDVHLLGYQQNPYPWIKFADCFILSSISEACPNVLLEAITLCIPLISTKCAPDIDSIMTNANHSRIVEVGDPRSMATAMNEINYYLINKQSSLYENRK